MWPATSAGRAPTSARYLDHLGYSATGTVPNLWVFRAWGTNHDRPRACKCRRCLRGNFLKRTQRWLPRSSPGGAQTATRQSVGRGENETSARSAQLSSGATAGQGNGPSVTALRLQITRDDVEESRATNGLRHLARSPPPRRIQQTDFPVARCPPWNRHQRARLAHILETLESFVFWSLSDGRRCRKLQRQTANQPLGQTGTGRNPRNTGGFVNVGGV